MFLLFVTKSRLTLCNPWTIARQALLSMGFPRQKYCSGFSFPSPGDLPDPGIEPKSPGLAGRFSLLCHKGNPEGDNNKTKIQSKINLLGY